MSGILALAGVIYLPSVIFIIFIPGAIVWLCWVLIAFGLPYVNNNWFWVFSLLWNGGWGVAFLVDLVRSPPGPILLVIHCSAAVIISMAALALNTNAMTKAEPGSR